METWDKAAKNSTFARTTTTSGWDTPFGIRFPFFFFFINIWEWWNRIGEFETVWQSSYLVYHEARIEKNANLPVASVILLLLYSYSYLISVTVWRFHDMIKSLIISRCYFNSTIVKKETVSPSYSFKKIHFCKNKLWHKIYFLVTPLDSNRTKMSGCWFQKSSPEISVYKGTTCFSSWFTTTTPGWNKNKNHIFWNNRKQKVQLTKLQWI